MTGPCGYVMRVRAPSGLGDRDAASRDGVRLRVAFAVLALVVAWPGASAGAQSPSTVAGDQSLPTECITSPRLIHAPPVGLEEIGRGEALRIDAGETVCIDYAPTLTTGQVKFDLRTLGPRGAYTAEVIYRTKGQPEVLRAPVEAGGSALFCFEQPGEDLARLYLVITNPSLDPATLVGGLIRVRPVAAPCGRYAVHSRYTGYDGGQVTLSIRVIGDVWLSRDPFDHPTPSRLEYEIVTPGQGAGGPQLAMSMPLALVGGLSAVAAPGADSRARCAPRTRLRYTGRTSITISFLQGGPYVISLLDRDGSFGRELVGGLFNMFERYTGSWVAVGFTGIFLLLIIAPLLMDLATFQLAVLAEQLLLRSDRSECGLTATRRSRTVVRVSDR